MNTDSCDMLPVESVEAVENGPPGAFYIETIEGHRWLHHNLPSGHYGAIALRPTAPVELSAYPARNPHSWEWDGNAERPTLIPSVHLPGVWHGWFTAGRMVSC